MLDREGYPGPQDAALIGDEKAVCAVLTNHHVVADVVRGQVPPAAVRCVFDFNVREDGTVDEGVAISLGDGGDWLVAAGAPSEVDEQDESTRWLAVDELDFALLRLAEPTGLSTSLDGRERGWLRLLGPTPEVTPGLPLLIVQYPRGGPVKLAMAEAGVEAVNDNRTRLAYSVNTEIASSGSPCLNLRSIWSSSHSTALAEHTTTRASQSPRLPPISATRASSPCKQLMRRGAPQSTTRRLPDHRARTINRARQIRPPTTHGWATYPKPR
jgi:hypothetical protein